MKQEEFSYPSRDGKTQLFAMRYLPDSEPSAIVQIVPGFCADLRAYEPFARKLAANGILVVGADLPGFGGSVSDETQRGCWPQEKGTECLLTDVRNLFRMTIKEHETTPYFLFGEEEGSLLLQQYVTIFSDELNGVILSGANRLAPHHLRRLKWKARFSGTADGWHTRKETLTNAVFGSHLNREEQETISVGVCYEVLRQMEWVSQKPYLKRIANGLPFLLLGGAEEQESADALRTVYVIYLQNRIRDVVMRTYPGRGRDLLADPDAEEVREDVLAWLFARAARGR